MKDGAHLGGKITGKLFDIQSYSIHDGPGIRTTFFFKGCPLSCKWCQNPESQKFEEQLFVVKNTCVGCRGCEKVCIQKAISFREGRAVSDRRQCIACGTCTSVCPKNARKICGRDYTVEELLTYAMADYIFYEGSGGGITVSGGEVLAQADFVSEFLKACKEKGLHVAVDTTGFATWENAWKVFQYADLVLYDIKHMDSGIHKELTGVPNERILDNLRNLSKKPCEIYIRVPVVPGMNDSDENIQKTAVFVKQELDGKYKTFLLPYHRMGEAKLDSLDETEGYLDMQAPVPEHMEHLKHFFDELGLECQIGG